jgi:hypothetical protein
MTAAPRPHATAASGCRVRLSTKASLKWAQERGSVTAELAVGLPAVVLVLVTALTVAAAGMAQLRCADGARAGARAVALGSDDAVADARRVAGDGAQVVLSTAGGWATVTVSSDVGGVPWGGGPLRASATAVARLEPSAGAATAGVAVEGGRE